MKAARSPLLSSLKKTWPGEWPGAESISMKSLSRYGPPLIRSALPYSRIGTTHSRNVPSSAGPSRHPFPIFLLGIPADMIVMQMGAHHEVDVFGPRSRGGKPLEVGQIEHVPEGPPGLG